MQIQLNYMYETGKWRVSTPSMHYRECYASDLQTTISQVIKDYTGMLATMAASIKPEPQSIEEDKVVRANPN